MREHVGIIERKTKLVESQIQEKKDFLSSVDDMSIISTKKALISLKTYKNQFSPNTDSSLPSTGIVNLGTRVDAGCDCDNTCKCQLSAAIEVEPISDTEICDTNQLGQHLFEEVSDPEMSSCVNENDKSGAKKDFNMTSEVCSHLKYGREESVTTPVTNSLLGFSQSDSVEVKISCQDVSVSTPTSSSALTIPFSNAAKRIIRDEIHLQSCTALAPHIASCSTVSFSKLSTISKCGNEVTPHVHSGLFTLSNEPPFLPVPSHDTLHVIPTCINPAIHVHCEQNHFFAKVKCTENLPPVSTKHNSSNQRSRKQKNPTKRVYPSILFSSHKPVGITSSSKCEKHAVCEDTKKQNHSLLIDSDIPQSIIAVNEGSIVKHDLTMSTYDRVVSILQQAFKTCGQDCQSLAYDVVEKLLLATNVFLEQYSIHTCSAFPLSLLYNITNKAQPSPVKLPDTFLHLPSNPSCTVVGGLYIPYSSPLLIFNSYLLNPAYKKYEKFQLGSITYSNNIDHSQVFCKFELLGMCKDPSCTAQHMRQVIPSNMDIVSKLVAQAPQIALCVSSEHVVSSVKKNQFLRKISTDEISQYSCAVVNRYSSKLSDEEMYRLVAHKVVKAKRLDDPNYGERYFVTFKDGDQFSKAPYQFSQSTEVNMAHVCLSDVRKTESPSVCVSSDGDHVSERLVVCIYMIKRFIFFSRRYFQSSIQETKPGDNSVNVYLKMADNCVAMNKYANAMRAVKSGLEKNITSVVCC